MIGRTLAFSLVAASLSSLGYAGPAVAECRVAVVVDEHAGDTRRKTQLVAAAVSKHFAGREDVLLIDPAQAQAARHALGEAPLGDRDIPAIITALDADLLVVGSAWFSPRTDKIENLVAIDATASVKLVTSDSARVLAFDNAKALGTHFSATQAERRAANALGKDIHARLQPAFERGCGGQRMFQVVVELHGDTSPTSTAEVVRAIGGIEGVESARAAFQSSKTLRLNVRSSLEPLTLAERMSALGRGVRVHALSGHRIDADFVLGDLLSVELVYLPFKGPRDKKGRGSGPGSLEREIAEQIGTGLAQLDLVHFPADEGLIGPREARVQRSGRLVLSGSFARSKDTIRVSARIQASATREELLFEQALCPSDSIPACVFELTERLKSALPPIVEAKKGPIGARGASVPTRDRYLEIALPAAFEGIYPALAGYYARHPVAVFEVHNRSLHRVSKIELELELEGFSKRPHLLRVESLEPGERREAELALHLDPVKLAAQHHNRVATLSARASFLAKEARLEETRELSVVVLDRNAHRWRRDRGRAVASFVTHRAPAVAALAHLADEALESRPSVEHEESPVARVVALFGALRGLRYRPDPVNPFDPSELDRVLFPAETLRARAGDCDDLAVLFAALLEAWAIPAALVQLPGHVLTMAEVTLGPSARVAWSDDPERFVVEDGSVWIPVETTALEKSFDEAWQLGVETLARARRAGIEIRLIDVREAWSEGYQPFDLAGGGPVPPFEIDESRIQKELDAYERARRHRLQDALQMLEGSSTAQALSIAGVTLALLGQLEEAERALERSHLTDPRQPGVINNLANVYLLKGALRRALERYEAALALAGHDPRIRYNAVIAAHLYQSEDPSEANRRAFEDHVGALCNASSEMCEAMYERIFTQPSLTSGSVAVELLGLRRRLAEILKKDLDLGAAKTAALAGRGGIAEHIHWLE